MFATAASISRRNSGAMAGTGICWKKPHGSHPSAPRVKAAHDRDRHPDEDAEEPGEREAPAAEARATRDSSYGRAKRPASRSNERRTSDPQRLRERLREDSEAGNLDKRDYEILSMMADGIRPILDRLDEIEGRVGEMETGDAPVPSNVRNWLSTQIADTFEDPRSATREVALGRTVSDLEARLPQLIEEAVTARFHNMASKLQQEIEETHVRTLETFVKNIPMTCAARFGARNRYVEASGSDESAARVFATHGR